MATGISFAGNDNEPTKSVETAEAKPASVSHDGPIQSPVPDSGATMSTAGNGQTYDGTPSVTGKGIDFVD